MSYFIYVIMNPETKTYIGYTINLSKRISEHNNPNNKKSHYTKRYKGPWSLIYSEEFETSAEAISREKWLKSSSGRRWLKKEILI